MRKQKRKFYIGENVIIRGVSDGMVYKVYSYTRYHGGRITYTLWNNNYYPAGIDQYQIKRTKPSSIGFTTNE